MSMGGKRKGAGRPKGSLNKQTIEILTAADESGLSPVDYMLKVMRDKRCQHERRDRMAAAVAPYVHPRLAQVQHSGDMTLVHRDMTQADLAMRLTAAGLDPDVVIAGISSSAIN